jgi:sugar lactone lactonase YvrE
LASGDGTVISDATTGTGPLLQGPRGVLAGGPDQAWVVDYLGKQVVLVTLSTGNRQEISGPGVGAGPGMDRPRAIVGDHVGLWLVDSSLDALVAVASDGGRTLVSDHRVDTLPAMRDPVAGAASPETVWLADSFREAVIAVDLEAGEAQVVSDASHGMGPSITQPTEMTRHPDNGMLLVSDAVHGAILAVDPVTGDRTIWSAAA